MQIRMQVKILIVQARANVSFDLILIDKRASLLRFFFVIVSPRLKYYFLESAMSQNAVEKRSVPWVLMGLGLLIPIFIVGMAFLAAKSDAKTKKEYDQRHAEIAKKFEQQKIAEQAAMSEE